MGSDLPIASSIERPSYAFFNALEDFLAARDVSYVYQRLPGRTRQNVRGILQVQCRGQVRTQVYVSEEGRNWGDMEGR
jgi:hypothetical protein